METSAPEKPWFLPVIVQFLTHDVPQLLRVPPSAFARDVITLEKRVASEGLSFLTKTLPSLGEAFDLALQGRTTFCHRSFRSRGGQPAFLQAITRQVFRDGHLVDIPNLEAIRLFRQVAYWFKKLERGFTDEALQLAINDVKNVDGCLPAGSENLTASILGCARAVTEHVLRDYECVQGLPQHGPGAVEGGQNVVEKRRLTTSYKDLESVFRPIPWFFSLRDASESYEQILNRPKIEYGTARLEFVEKDSRGPRVICLMPAEYMWCQQAIKRSLYHYIESTSPSKGQINFTDQSINRKLTAAWKDWDTLDMSKASDRNSLALVRALFERTKVWPYLLASRTTFVRLPNKESFENRSFAPMGSATCFPVQAIVYYALACASLHVRGRIPLAIAFSKVFVYGDDIVIPHGYFEFIKKDFEAVGLVFNMTKSCYSGKFRESCGMDAYDGFDVTPIRARKFDPENKDPLAIIPLIEHTNKLMKAGYTSASRCLRRLLLQHSHIKKLRLKVVSNASLPILFWYDPDAREHRLRYRNCIPHVTGWSFTPAKVEGEQCCEAKYFRESLSSGGQVGSQRRIRGEWVRFFTLRYRGRLSKKCLPYWPTPEGPLDLVVRIDQSAVSQQPT